MNSIAKKIYGAAVKHQGQISECNARLTRPVWSRKAEGKSVACAAAGLCFIIIDSDTRNNWLLRRTVKIST